MFYFCIVSSLLTLLDTYEFNLGKKYWLRNCRLRICKFQPCNFYGYEFVAYVFVGYEFVSYEFVGYEFCAHLSNACQPTRNRVSITENTEFPGSLSEFPCSILEPENCLQRKKPESCWFSKLLFILDKIMNFKAISLSEFVKNVTFEKKTLLSPHLK